MEIDPLYVDVAINRWQAFTGKEATLEADGRTFAEVTGYRSAEGDPVSSSADNAEGA